MNFWQQPLTEEQTSELIERLAQWSVRKGLGAAAVLFLELHKPLTFIASQTAIVFSPFLIPFLGFDRVDQYTQLFQSRENVERLIQRIEELEEANRSSQSAKEEAG